MDLNEKANPDPNEVEEAATELQPIELDDEPTVPLPIRTRPWQATLPGWAPGSGEDVDFTSLMGSSEGNTSSVSESLQPPAATAFAPYEQALLLKSGFSSIAPLVAETGLPDPVAPRSDLKTSGWVMVTLASMVVAALIGVGAGRFATHQHGLVASAAQAPQQLDEVTIVASVVDEDTKPSDTTKGASTAFTYVIAAKPAVAAHAQEHAVADQDQGANEEAIDESNRGPFEPEDAQNALSQAALEAESCNEGGPSALARVAVTFVPSGHVTQAVVEGPPFAGTPVGSCIAKHLRAATVAPFAGSPVTVSKTIAIH